MSVSGSQPPILRGWQRFWGGSSPTKRLRDVLPAFRYDLDYLIKRAIANGGAKPAWSEQALVLLCQVEQAMARNNPEEGWRLFHAAQRMELYGLRETDSAAFHARRHSIHNEATSKLRSWLLNPEVPAAVRPEPGMDEELAAVIESALLLHEHFSNEAIKRNASVNQTGLIVGFGLGAMFLWLVAYGPRVLQTVPQTGGGLAWTGSLLHSALLFGLMGASFSALIKLASQSATQTIPEQFLTYRITLGRQAVGVLSALVVCVLLTSGFLQIGIYPVTPSLVLLGAFGAGFSERLVLRTLDRFTEAADKVEKKEDRPVLDHQGLGIDRAADQRQ